MEDKSVRSGRPVSGLEVVPMATSAAAANGGAAAAAGGAGRPVPAPILTQSASLSSLQQNSSFDMTDAYQNERSARALGYVFSRLGRCQLKEARQIVAQFALDLDGSLPQGIWQCHHGRTLSESFQDLIDMEDHIVTLRMVDAEYWDTVQPTLVELGTLLKAAYNRATMQSISSKVEWVHVLSQVLMMRADFVGILTEIGRDQSLDKCVAYTRALERAEKLAEEEEEDGDVDGTRKMGMIKGPRTGGDRIEAGSAFLNEYRIRVVEELRVLRQLLVANESIITFDFLATSTSLYVALSSLMHLSKSMEMRASVERPTTSQSSKDSSAGKGAFAGGARSISEWWTQMDGYWGVNTTRALQQYLNSQIQAHLNKGSQQQASHQSPMRTFVDDSKTAIGGAITQITGSSHSPSVSKVGQAAAAVASRSFRTSVPDSLSVDGAFSKRTISALQWHVNQQRSMYMAASHRADDQSLRANQVRPGRHGPTLHVSRDVMSKWQEVSVDGAWNRESKTALQCLVKAKVPSISMNIDGRFHHHSTRGLQMLLAQERWYRPGLHNDTNVHQSRVTVHCLALHQWLCVLQENLTANAALIFHNVTSNMPVQRDMGRLSQRTAVSYFDAIVLFVKKSEVMRVVIIADVSGNDKFSPVGYSIPPAFGTESAAPSGLQSLPDVFCYPPDASGESWRRVHMPIIVTLCIDPQFSRIKRNAHDTPHPSGTKIEGSQITYFWEQKTNTSYFLKQVEPRLTICVMVEGNKRKAKSGTVSRFMTFVADGLSSVAILEMLKPSAMKTLSRSSSPTIARGNLSPAPGTPGNKNIAHSYLNRDTVPQNSGSLMSRIASQGSSLFRSPTRKAPSDRGNNSPLNLQVSRARRRSSEAEAIPGPRARWDASPEQDDDSVQRSRSADASSFVHGNFTRKPEGDADIRLDAVSDDGMPYNPVSISVGGSACLTAPSLRQTACQYPDYDCSTSFPPACD